MEYSPMPLEESERRGLSRECNESLVVAALQGLFIYQMENHDEPREA